MKKTIHLKETELKRMIAESVRRVLSESQVNITWDDFFKNNDEFTQINAANFKNFEADDWFETEELLQYNKNIEPFCDEDSGDLLCIIRGNKNEEIGTPCSSIFEANDKQILPYLWSTNGGKTAHALDKNGNIISPEFVGIFDLTDVELLLDTKRNIYISASWIKSDTAYKYISNPLCNLKDVIGIVGGLGVTLFFRSNGKAKWVNLHDDITVIHSAPMDEQIPLNKYNRFDYHFN